MSPASGQPRLADRDAATPGLHLWAWVLACATLPLIWWGGFVTSTDAGMAFRDWITSDGHFMLIYPWLSSSGDKFVEHGHRLLAALVGFLSILLVVIAWRTGARRSLQVLSWCVLAGVIGQGLLGGLRVVLDQRTLALAHGCTGPLFFILCAAMVVTTSHHWRRAVASDQPVPAGMARTAVMCAALAYLQILAGAVLRHAPHLTGEAAARLFQAAVYFHLLIAVALPAYVLTLAAGAWRHGRLRKLATSLVLLVVVQLGLGAATWLVKYGLPRGMEAFAGSLHVLNIEASVAQAAIVTSHVATGSLIVAVGCAAAMLAVRGSRWSVPRLSSDATRVGGAIA